MTDRILLDGDRLIISRPGYSATDPGLPDVGKVFDSNWLANGAIIMQGYFTFPFVNNGPGFYDIPFGPLGYVPSAYVYSAIPYTSGSYVDDGPYRIIEPVFTINNSPIYLTNSAIRIPQSVGRAVGYPGDNYFVSFYAIVFAV